MPLAQNDLGHLYALGLGVPKSRTMAAKWFRMAAAQGDDVAQVNLGNYYYYGYEIGTDYSEALKWFARAAEKGNAQANLMLARMYKNGDGVAKDEKQAERRLTLALKGQPGNAVFRAFAGFAVGGDGYFIVWPRRSKQAQREVDDLDDFLIALNYPEVVRALQTKPDDPAYLSWLRNRAEEGHPQLQWLLSQRLSKTDPVGAFMWLFLATLGTAQDAAMCQDRSARAATPVMLANFVMQVRKDPQFFDEAFQRGLKWDREHVGRPPPVAICFHGVQAYADPSKYPELIPESEWLSERLKTRDEVLKAIPELLSERPAR